MPKILSSFWQWLRNDQLEHAANQGLKTGDCALPTTVNARTALSSSIDITDLLQVLLFCLQNKNIL